MSRSVETSEPPEQACRVLMQFIEQESDPRKQILMLRDCRARARQLPAEAQRRIDKAMMRVLDPSAATDEEGGDTEQLSVIPTGTRKPVDVLVTTVVPIELTAARIAFDLPARPTKTHNNRRYYETQLHSEWVDRDLSVVITDIGDAGNAKAATAVSQMQQHYAPAAYFLVGIAAGREGAVELGDVVRPRIVMDFEGGTAYKREVKPRPEPKPVPERMFRNLNYYDPSTTNYYQRLQEAVKKLPREHWPPEDELDLPFRPDFPDKVVIATGEKVRRDSSLVALAKRHDERIKAADMESTGFAGQVGDVPWAVFRGITDFGNPKKADNWHGFAALAACVAVRDFLETQYEPPDVARL